MKKEKNKLKKFNSFDVLDAELLEEYLSKIALEGWMISNIGNMFFTFKKSSPMVVNFFVDITTKDLIGDNYISTTDYINASKEKGLEHVCGNKDFQVFINNGREQTLRRKKLKFTRAFKDDLSRLMCLIVAFIPQFINYFSDSDSFITFISDGALMVWTVMLWIIILLNIFATIIKSVKYTKKFKQENKNFNDIRNFKIKDRVNKCINLTIVLFLLTSLLALVNIGGGIGSITSKDELPLSLEDFDVDIQEKREYDISKSSSPFAKYTNCIDDTYKEVVTKSYDKESKSYYDEYNYENSVYLSYTIFESKYDKILNRALTSILKSYDKLDYNYKKIKDTKELKKWGAKEIYTVVTLDEKIIVYDDMIFQIDGDIDYNKKNIDIIKSKVLNKNRNKLC